MFPTGYAKQHADFLLLMIKLLDVSVIFFCGIGTFFILEPSKNIPIYSGFMPQSYMSALVLTFLLSALLFPVFNVYKSWRGESIKEEIYSLLLAWWCSMLGLMAFLVFTKTAETLSRHWMGLWFVVTFLSLILLRLVVRASLHTLRKRGLNQRHIVLVGTGDLSKQVVTKISSAPWMGLKISGYFADYEKPKSMSGLRHLGSVDGVVAYAETHEVDQVWLTFPLKEIDKIEQLSYQLSSVAVNVILVPDITSLRVLNSSVSLFDGLPVIDISVTPITGSNAGIKWLEDKILSFIILTLISPVMLLIALLIKLTSTGPVLYRQERVGWNGKRFQMLKFRTMPVNSPEQQQVWGNAKEKPKTRIGTVLRKTSLDELPQFINVLKGDMSIVGPRPERPVFVEQFKYEFDSYMQKLIVQAGITGWAQVNGFRGDTCLKTRVEYDLYYVENWSLWFDLKIIALTLIKGFRHEHAC